MNDEMKEKIRKQLWKRDIRKTFCRHDAEKICSECRKNIRGNVGGITGNVSGIRGNVCGIRGDVSGIRGDVSGITGDVDEILYIISEFSLKKGA